MLNNDQKKEYIFEAITDALTLVQSLQSDLVALKNDVLNAQLINGYEDKTELLGKIVERLDNVKSQVALLKKAVPNTHAKTTITDVRLYVIHPVLAMLLGEYAMGTITTTDNVNGTARLAGSRYTYDVRREGMQWTVIGSR